MGEDMQTTAASLSRRNGFIQVKVFPDAEVSLEEAKEIITAEVELAHGEKVPMIIDLRQCKGTTPEARAYWSDLKALQLLPAVAFLMRSPLIRVLGNVHLEIDAPLFPRRFFTTSETEALDWIKGFVD